MPNAHGFTLSGLDGHPLSFSQYKGKVLLLVNVASQCGLTPQYEGLQKLYDRYAAQGFQIVGLPCNQFGKQEPGSEAEIKTFCKNRFHVTFPMSAKIEVNGENRHPLYGYLTGEDAAFPGAITWNFEKFLIGKQGQVLRRFPPKTAPNDPELIQALEEALAQ